ncbi:hypothetical protein PTTG_25168 [Puccinia triticina 1-1 BBBD Race 1]|uniref:Acetyl-coenzyme A transporter 1 n=1 Tax=Puccinia triticina (isolate 1-1 / race 1 (BBBD)) TaxID=630390 RepID=A0A180H6R9_PUCT1|nr:hypothetical protein PTTG_25168 [Puccinia triticina 1-1 BBBD Race 1]
MTTRWGNRFAVLESHHGEDDEPESPKNKNKESKSVLPGSPKKAINEQGRSSSVSRNKQTGQPKNKMATRPVEVSDQMAVGLRGRNTAPTQSDDDLLEKGAGKASTPPPTSEKNHARVAKKKSKNLIKLSKRDAKLSEPHPPAPSMAALSSKDKRAMALLVVLYMLQGIPVGLAFGSVPFLLRARLSYTQIGLFSLASYPYSLKLLWSPIVDSCYFPSIGRRKSWIIPVQALVGVTLWWLGDHVSVLMDAEIPDVKTLTVLFFTLVMFAATQDIAVDGWALELLSQDNLSYASTAQTVGLNIGYFLSFTVFLAFNSLEFSNNRCRSLFGFPIQDYPLMTLSGYLKFGGVCFILVTLYLSFFQTEDPVDKDSPESNMDVKKVYQIMYEICKLKHVQSFILLHCIAKLGVSVNDAATSLKLLEKGLSKEDMALSVLIDFPFQIFLGYFAAKWSSGDKPLQPWIWAMWFRLAFSAWNVGLVYFFPEAKPLSNSYFILVIASTVMSSFASTVQFVGISAFHTQIADPLIGGTYMTLLNTVSNLGGTWPKYFVLKGVDFFTEANCLIPNANSTQREIDGKECVSDLGKAKCTDFHGNCHTTKDGYYIMQAICITLGALLLLLVIGPASRKLGALPARAWHVRKAL